MTPAMFKSGACDHRIGPAPGEAERAGPDGMQIRTGAGIFVANCAAGPLMGWLTPAASSESLAY